MSLTTRPRAPQWFDVRRPTGFLRKWLLVALVIVVVGGLVVWRMTREDGQWRPLMHEQFSADVPTGSFPSRAYSGNWTVYPDGWSDTSGVGTYAPRRVLSTGDGRLRFALRYEDREFLGAAVLAKPTKGQLYGRYAIRWRADPVAGYGLAFLLWPDSDEWPRDGEIDFPEGSLDGTTHAYAHYANPDGGQDSFNTGVTMQDWHTSVLEWTPDAVSFFLDGALVGRSTTDVPHKPMHLVLQAGTAGSDEPPRDAHGDIEVDWVNVESYQR
jgi:hypothetical protein